ncbi:MAG: ABC transporter permease [Roseburia inulinivorans]
MKKKNKIIEILFIMAVAFILIISDRGKVYAADAVVSFGRESYSVNMDDTFEIEVTIKADGNIGVYKVELQYDTGRLEYVSGAEAEEDGVITLEGTGFGNEITYDNITFKAIGGGNAGLKVKGAKIYSNGEEAESYAMGSQETLLINVDGTDTGEKSFFEQLMDEEETQTSSDTYGLETEVPVVGSIKKGNQLLYVVDIADYTPQIDLWDYKLVTDSYAGESLTFFSDQARNVRVMLIMDGDENFSIYAFNSQTANFYPVSEITSNDQKYYIMSLGACENIPDGLTTEEMQDNTVFYAINQNGSGDYYRYTTTGELVKWENTQANEETTSKSDFSKLVLYFILILVLGCIIGGLAFWFVRKRRKIGKKIKRQLDLFNENFSDRKQYFFVIRELTSREIKRKYARSYLGIIWSVLNPLLTMAVMSLIFSYMFKRSIENFPLYYLTGNIFWSLFSGATNSAMTALVDNKTLLLKAKLPKQTFVLSRVYTALTNFGYTCIAYVLMLIIFRVKPSWTMLLFPLDVALALVFAAGIGYMLSILYVFFADIKYLYSVLLTLLLYMSAIFYPVTSLPPVLQNVIGYNPIYMSIYIAREAVVYNRVPHYSAWIKLALAAAISLAIGLMVFKKKENDVMQRV